MSVVLSPFIQIRKIQPVAFINIIQKLNQLRVNFLIQVANRLTKWVETRNYYFESKESLGPFDWNLKFAFECKYFLHSNIWF